MEGWNTGWWHPEEKLNFKHSIKAPVCTHGYQHSCLGWVGIRLINTAKLQLKHHGETANSSNFSERRTDGRACGMQTRWRPEKQRQHPHSHRWCILTAWFIVVCLLLRRSLSALGIQKWCHTVQKVSLTFLWAPSRCWKMLKSRANLFIPMDYSMQLSGTDPEKSRKRTGGKRRHWGGGNYQLFLVFKTNKLVTLLWESIRFFFFFLGDVVALMSAEASAPGFQLSVTKL